MTLDWEKPEREAEAVYANTSGGAPNESSHPDFVIGGVDYEQGGVDFNVRFDKDTVLCAT
jgi:hypothetical protein